MPTYRYTGDAPSVFIQLMTDHGTWVPEKGDTYESATPIAHPLLDLVSDDEATELDVPQEPDVPEPPAPVADVPQETVPAEPENTESPETADLEGEQ